MLTLEEEGEEGAQEDHGAKGVDGEHVASFVQVLVAQVARVADT